MHNGDKDIYDMVAQAELPPHSADLPERIISAAMAAGHERQNAPAVMQVVKSGGGFSTWWAAARAQHGQKMAVAAAVAMLAVIVFDPAGKITGHYVQEQHYAETERYMVNGVPLLADVSLLDEQEMEFEFEYVMLSAHF